MHLLVTHKSLLLRYNYMFITCILFFYIAMPKSWISLDLVSVCGLKNVCNVLFQVLASGFLPATVLGLVIHNRWIPNWISQRSQIEHRPYQTNQKLNTSFHTFEDSTHGYQIDYKSNIGWIGILCFTDLTLESNLIPLKILIQFSNY